MAMNLHFREQLYGDPEDSVRRHERLLDLIEAGDVADRCRAGDISMFFGVPAMYQRLLSTGRAASLSKLRLVVSGTPTVRHPGGEDQLEAWDLFFFPSGPAGAHLVRNDSGSTARVAMFSSITAVGAVVYQVLWVIADDDPNEYFLSGTFTINPPADAAATNNEHVWRGTIELPAVKLGG